jgi:hypothetical protein
MNFDKANEMHLSVYTQLLQEHATNTALRTCEGAGQYKALQNAVHNSILCLGDYGRLTPVNLAATVAKAS